MPESRVELDPRELASQLYYKVQKGDTLSEISRKLGMDPNVLIEKNPNIQNIDPRHLQIGTELVGPKKLLDRSKMMPLYENNDFGAPQEPPYAWGGGTEGTLTGEPAPADQSVPLPTPSPFRQQPDAPYMGPDVPPGALSDDRIYAVPSDNQLVGALGLTAAGKLARAIFAGKKSLEQSGLNLDDLNPQQYMAALRSRLQEGYGNVNTGKTPGQNWQMPEAPAAEAPANPSFTEALRNIHRQALRSQRRPIREIENYSPAERARVRDAAISARRSRPSELIDEVVRRARDIQQDPMPRPFRYKPGHTGPKRNSLGMPENLLPDRHRFFTGD